MCAGRSHATSRGDPARNPRWDDAWFPYGSEGAEAAGVRACCFPTEGEAAELGAALGTLGVRRVVSVGSGPEAVLEGALSRAAPAAEGGQGLRVQAVDVRGVDGRAMCYLPRECPPVALLESPSYLYDVAADDDASLGETAVVFCYGRRCPLGAYLAQFRGLGAVVLVGDLTPAGSPLRGAGDPASLCPTWDSVAQPPADALAGDDEAGWAVAHVMPISAVSRAARAYVYRPLRS